MGPTNSWGRKVEGNPVAYMQPPKKEKRYAREIIIFAKYLFFSLLLKHGVTSNANT